jgi:hypothetical protein
MPSTFKLLADKMGGRDAAAYIGTSGEIFYDVTGATPLRLSDGVTPGGIPFAITTISNTFNPNFTDLSGTFAGGTSTGSYVLQGAICHFRVNVVFTGVTNFGTLGYKITLPFPTVSTVTIRGGSLHQVSGSGSPAIFHIAGITDIAESTTAHKLYYTGSTTDLPWKYNTPVSATNVDSHFDLSGAYQIAI